MSDRAGLSRRAPRNEWFRRRVCASGSLGHHSRIVPAGTANVLLPDYTVSRMLGGPTCDRMGDGRSLITVGLAPARASLRSQKFRATVETADGSSRLGVGFVVGTRFGFDLLSIG